MMSLDKEQESQPPALVALLRFVQKVWSQTKYFRLRLIYEVSYEDIEGEVSQSWDQGYKVKK